MENLQLNIYHASILEVIEGYEKDYKTRKEQLEAYKKNLLDKIKSKNSYWQQIEIAWNELFREYSKP